MGRRRPPHGRRDRVGAHDPARPCPCGGAAAARAAARQLRVTPDETLPQGDKGGNTFRLDDDRNLHGYWDHILDASVAPDPGEDSIAYADRIAHRIEETHPLAAPLAATDVLGWAQEGLRLAQTVAYAGVTRGSAPSPAYEAEALKVSELRIALAGYRLSALLNAALQ